MLCYTLAVDTSCSERSKIFYWKTKSGSELLMNVICACLQILDVKDEFLWKFFQALSDGL